MFSVPKPTSPTAAEDSSSANVATANLLIPPFSMTTSAFNPFMNMGLPIPSIPFPTVPGFTSAAPLLMPPPPNYTDALRLMEIARLAVNTSQVSLVDKEEIKPEMRSQSPPINIDDDEDQPLDLSLKSQNPESSEASTSSFRPSVIRAGGLSPGPRNCDIKRSASSVSHRVTPEPDVAEHFHRSLSGKWPKRPTNHGHYSLPQSSHHLSTQSMSASLNSGPFLNRQDLSRSNSPFASNSITKRLSFSSASRSNCSSPQIRRVASTPKRTQIIYCEGDNSQVETHFRRALGEETYEKFRAATIQKRD
ncbi:hypothetical protein FO519_005784 [Halicephalobus sp. NKZ332]|nr:hypothetical protein FO519_005784 [Halicephalobus sp. NKZ332]